MKNLQKLQKSGQSRKKSGQFGKSNKILLMSGTKSKMMEMSAAASKADKSRIDKSGAVSKGTATLIELRQVVGGVTPDLMKQDGPQGASQTYNNASKLLASAHASDSNVSDYGGYRQSSVKNVPLATNYKNKKPTQSITQNNSQTLLHTLSEDNELAAPDGVPMTSVFDQLEEMQFMSYELGTKLRSLVETILQHSGADARFMAGNGGAMGLTVQADTWEAIENVAKEATSDFELIQEALRSFFDRMQEEVAKWKRRCSKL